MRARFGCPVLSGVEGVGAGRSPGAGVVVAVWSGLRLVGVVVHWLRD